MSDVVESKTRRYVVNYTDVNLIKQLARKNYDVNKQVGDYDPPGGGTPWLIHPQVGVRNYSNYIEETLAEAIASNKNPEPKMGNTMDVGDLQEDESPGRAGGRIN